MASNWFRLPVAVMIVIRQQDKVLLAKRQNTGYKDDYFALPGGKHDGRETLTQSVIREAQEELGIHCAPEDVVFRGMLHVNLTEPPLEVMYVTFEVMQYQGEIINNEPHKCSELQFFPIDQLPEKMTDISRKCVQNTLTDVAFEEAGWIDPVEI